VIALLGNLSRDFLPGVPPRVGGAPFHAARAFQQLGTAGVIYARCAVEDRAELLPPLVALGTPVHYVRGEHTAGFEISYEGDRRLMTVRSLGDTWLTEDLPQLAEDVRWVHVAPLARTDFPAETLAAAARGRRLSLDGQGLVRPGATGLLELDADFDPAVLRHVWVLKLSEEEAEVLGDPLALGVRELLVTHGARGATVYAGGRVDHVPAFAIDRDPTGAGDAFCVSYLSARSVGFAPAAAARRATAVVAAMLAESG
jgi:sugar/nucleoside kinase (ribokinase family)